MIAGICGGLDPGLEVGTLINPEVVIDYAVAPPTGTRLLVMERSRESSSPPWK